jgi:uncharacterized protein YukE
MDFFNFERGPVEQVISTVMSQKSEMEDVQSKTQGYVPKVMSAWRGGDEREFEADVQRKLIPAIMKLIAAIAGFGGNLGGAMNVMDQADSKITSMVGGISDMFGSFLK